MFHRVVDGHHPRDVAAWGVYIQGDVFVGIFGVEMNHLRNDEIGELVVDRLSEKHDPLAEEA
jgi:hypothetical protein